MHFSCRHGSVAVGQEGAHGQRVAALGVDHVGDLLDERCREPAGVVVHELGVDVGPFRGNLDLDILASAVDGRVVHVHDVLALLAVGLEGRVLHVLHGVVDGDDAGDAEERALEYGVGASSESYLLGYLGGVDDVEPDLLASDHRLHIVGDALHGLLLVPEGVEQEAAAFLDALEHIVFLEV